MENTEGEYMTTILLVDDEENVRNLVTATLKGKGYKILLARDSDQAMQMSDAHEGSIELLGALSSPLAYRSAQAQARRVAATYREPDAGRYSVQAVGS